MRLSLYYKEEFVLMKVTEAGFFPAALAVCGDWYHPLNLQVRIAFFYTMGQFSGAFGGLLAYAIHYMDGAGGLASWRWQVPFIPLANPR